MKRIISLLMVAVLLVGCVISVSAAGNGTLSVSNATAEPGETVTLNVELKNNPGFANYGIVIDYDEDALEITEIVAGALSNGLFVSNIAYGEGQGFATFTTFSNVTADGVLFTVTFKVIAETSGTYPVATAIDSFNDASAAAVSVADATGNVTVNVTCKHTNTEISGKKDATCSAEGYTGDTVCKDCGAVTEKGSTIAKLAHTTEVINAKDATCSEEGYTGDTVCTECGYTVKKGEVIAKLAHKTEVKDAKEATCIEEGYTGDEICTVCGEVVKQGEVIEAAGHKYDWIIDKKPTATEDGSKHEECSVCGDKKDPVVIPATGEELDDVPVTGDIVIDYAPVVFITIVVMCMAAAVIVKRRFVK